MGVHNHREAKANALARRFDEIAAAAGCDVPTSVLASLVRLFGEALTGTNGTRPNYEFTRCGALDHVAEGTKPRCVLKWGHAGRHFAVTGQRWGEDKPAEPQEQLNLLCFSGTCNAIATHGKFCDRHFGVPSSDRNG